MVKRVSKILYHFSPNFIYLPFFKKIAHLFLEINMFLPNYKYYLPFFNQITNFTYFYFTSFLLTFFIPNYQFLPYFTYFVTKLTILLTFFLQIANFTYLFLPDSTILLTFFTKLQILLSHLFTKKVSKILYFFSPNFIYLFFF